MGGGRWSTDDFTSHTRSYSSKSRAEIFSSECHKDLDPRKIDIRESCDSTDNPAATPIILGLDVTGSMGHLAEAIARNGLNKTCTELYKRKPVTDPHIMIMGIGDVDTDNDPLQVSQFEADIRILKHLEHLYLEGGGGGNHRESYTIPWLFAAKKTKIDSLIKRKKKGYLFTIGDERPNLEVTGKGYLTAKTGLKLSETTSSKDLLKEVKKSYDVFHLMVEESGTFQGDEKQTVALWRDLLGENARRLKDVSKLPEVIVSIIQANEGMDPEEIAESWEADSQDSVRHTLNLRKR